jgi:hypothetical protein
MGMNTDALQRKEGEMMPHTISSLFSTRRRRLPGITSHLLSSNRRKRLSTTVTWCAFALAIGQVAKSETLFNAKSPWNTRIPATAVFGSKAVAAGRPVGLDTWDPGGYWTVNYYIAKASDPKVRILYNEYAWGAVFAGRWKRQGNTAAVEREITASSSKTFPYPGNVYSSTSTTSWKMPASYNKLVQDASQAAWFSLPEGALPPIGADGHMAVRQPTNGVLETYATIVLSDGTIVALSYSLTDPTGLGDGWQRGQTASMLPSYAGAILDEEITPGIQHAMAITVPPELLTPVIAYPAYAFDRDAVTNSYPYSGTLPMGARLALPRTLNLDGLGLATKAGRAIAAAAQKYGFIIVDRGGEGITIRVRPTRNPSQATLHAYDWGLSNDLTKILGNVRLVTFRQ